MAEITEPTLSVRPMGAYVFISLNPCRHLTYLHFSREADEHIKNAPSFGSQKNAYNGTALLGIYSLYRKESFIFFAVYTNELIFVVLFILRRNKNIDRENT